MSRVPMCFYHADGLVPAWTNALAYANEGGRIATLPEIIEARMLAPTDSVVWNSYFTTRTAEYLGYGADDRLKIIVAHGVGPLATLEGIKKAYAYSYKSKDRNKRGGRITHQEFLKLEAGVYGPVHVVDYEDYVREFEYPFIEPTNYLLFRSDKLVEARFGKPELVKQFAKRLLQINQEYIIQEVIPGFDPNDGLQRWFNRTTLKQIGRNKEYLNPPILINSDEHNLPYFAYTQLHPKGEWAFAHLLSIGGNQLTKFCENYYACYISDIACHSWNDGTRFLVIPHDAKLDTVIDGPDPRMLIRKHWQELFIPTTTKFVSSMFTIMKMGDNFFTEYRGPKDVMDSAEPQFVIQSIEPVGDVIRFVTPVLGYYGFFKYEIDEMIRQAPPQANAYRFVGEPEIVWKDGDAHSQTCDVQFYKITVDSSQEIMRSQELSHNFELMLHLIGY